MESTRLHYVRALARDLAPPLLVRALRRLVSSTPNREPHGEKTADWYDRAFEDSPAWAAHYTESPYYPVWAVLIDRIRSESTRSILEIACGTGQLAWALHDGRLIDSYSGFDFSPKRIAQARSNCPELCFEVDDAFATTVFDRFPYNIVIATEFLEHVEQDLRVVGRIKPQTRFLGTVPSYPWKSHVRHFRSVEDVLERYEPHFTDLDVFPLIRKRTGETLFVMDGRKI